MRKFWLKLIVATFGLFLLSGCASEAQVVSSNLSKEADNFTVLRRITFINTMTDEVLFVMEGNISIFADNSDNQLEISAKVGENTYQKHFLGLSPTTIYVAEQLEWVEANKYQFKVIMRPSTLIPDIEVK